MKKAALVLSLMLMMSTTAFAQGGQQVRLYKNYDSEIQLSCPLAEKNGTLYMSARDLCDFALGGADSITWVDDAKLGYIGSLNARIYAGSCKYQIAGKDYASSQPAEIVDGRLMIPLDTAEALADINNRCFYYDPENCRLNYLQPDYEFGNSKSDYRMSLIAVDLKAENMDELQKEVERIAAANDSFTENDKMTVKSVTEVSEGFGTVVFTVSGENPRDIAVQIRHGYAVKVCDPYNLPQRMDNKETAPNGAGMGNGYQHEKNK